MARKKRGIPEINAGSMADIAFLLLVFFLVTTTMDIPTGIRVQLPPISDEPPDKSQQKEREVLKVLVNSRDQLLVEGELMQIDRLREKTKRHLTNEGRDPNLSTTSTEAIVSLKNDRSTSYEMYLKVYNELQAAYAEVRDEFSVGKYGVEFTNLRDTSRINTVKRKYPKKLSEAEPVDVEGEI